MYTSWLFRNWVVTSSRAGRGPSRFAAADVVPTHASATTATKAIPTPLMPRA